MVVNTNACLTGTLQNGSLGDEAFEHLNAQLLHGRQLNVLTAQVDRNRVHALLEFVLGDNVVVDNSDDSVEVDFVVGRGSLGFGSRLRGGVSRQRISRLRGLRAGRQRPSGRKPQQRRRESTLTRLYS